MRTRIYKDSRGFTLAEIGIAIALVGIVMALALPALQRPVRLALVAPPDPELAQVLKQNMAFTAPTLMQLGARASVEVALGGDKSVDELIELLRRSGQSGGESIVVSDRMAARLLAPGFAVTPVTAEIQTVSRTQPTVWKWDIEATSVGRQQIHLVIDALYSIGGKDAARSTSLNRPVIVEVESWDARWAWVKQNWAIVAFSVTGVAGLIAFMVNRKRPEEPPTA